MENNRSDVGDTGGKGLMLSLHWGDLEDGGNNEDIGDEDQH